MALERKVSYFLFALLAASIVVFELGAAFLASIIAFLILDATNDFIGRWLGKKLSRLISLIFFVIAAISLFWIFADFARLAISRAPMIVQSLIPKLKGIAGQWNISLPFENLDELRILIANSAKDNLHQLTRTSSLLTSGFLHIALAIFTAVACFWSQSAVVTEKKSDFSSALGEEMTHRMTLFMAGFKKAFGAQFIVSLINTGFVSFLLLFLHIPYVRFLITATFILSFIPVIGGLVINLSILAAAWTVSSKTVLIAFAALAIFHHVLYLIQGQVIGEQMKIPAWQVLLGLILGEAVLGIAGMVLAPAVICYLREELNTFSA